jgi:hypothetical protein
MASRRFRSRMKKQKCVYWKKNGTDRYGQPTYDTYTILLCRWEENISDSVINGQQEIDYSVTAYLPQEVFEGDFLYFDGWSSSVLDSTIDSVIVGASAETDPLKLTGSRKIETTRNNPDFKNRHTEYSVLL